MGPLAFLLTLQVISTPPSKGVKHTSNRVGVQNFYSHDSVKHFGRVWYSDGSSYDRVEYHTGEVFLIDDCDNWTRIR